MDLDIVCCFFPLFTSKKFSTLGKQEKKKYRGYDIGTYNPSECYHGKLEINDLQNKYIIIKRYRAFKKSKNHELMILQRIRL